MAQRRGFVTRFEDLPETLPVFPLDGVLLLPGGRLPLVIFEPRYIAMIDDALATHRLIGMIQPQPGEQELAVPRLYSTGCSGRLIEFSETPDNRYLITLFGVSRFNISREFETIRGYRHIQPDWTPYCNDAEGGLNADVDRERLLQVLRAFLDGKGIKADWKSIEDTPDIPLVTSLAMTCPFEPSEKQALLVAEDIGARARTMIAILEMAMHSVAGPHDARH